MSERKCVRTRQCAKCPWKKSTDPHDIPNGYSEELHEGLRGTIAEPGSLSSTMRVMACHESPIGSEQYCVGWLQQQLGNGNNLSLRLRAMSGEFKDVEWPDLDTQHATFDDTLPE